MFRYVSQFFAKPIVGGSCVFIFVDTLFFRLIALAELNRIATLCPYKNPFIKDCRMFIAETFQCVNDLARYRWGQAQ